MKHMGRRRRDSHLEHVRGQSERLAESPEGWERSSRETARRVLDEYLNFYFDMTGRYASGFELRIGQNLDNHITATGRLLWMPKLPYTVDIPANLTDYQLRVKVAHRAAHVIQAHMHGRAEQLRGMVDRVYRHAGKGSVDWYGRGPYPFRNIQDRRAAFEASALFLSEAFAANTSGECANIPYRIISRLDGMSSFRSDALYNAGAVIRGASLGNLYGIDNAYVQIGEVSKQLRWLDSGKVPETSDALFDALLHGACSAAGLYRVTGENEAILLDRIVKIKVPELLALLVFGDNEGDVRGTIRSLARLDTGMTIRRAKSVLRNESDVDFINEMLDSFRI